MKKIVALLLSLCLVLGAASAMAAGEKIALITMDSIDQHTGSPSTRAPRRPPRSSA